MEDGVDGGLLLHSETESCVRFIELRQDYRGSGVYISHVKSAGLAAVQDHILPFKLFLLTHFNRDPDDHFSPVLVIEVSSIFNFLYSESETTTEVKSLEKQVTKRERADRRQAE